MQNLQTNSEVTISQEALLQNFQVEELEERLENKWMEQISVVVDVNGVPVQVGGQTQDE